MSDVTLILSALEQGDDKALDRLLPAVYQELRLLAAQKLSNERPDHTLQATALVHEAYLRLIGLNHQSYKSRAYFFGAAAEAMRRILIENARRKQRLKRGGQFEKANIPDNDLAIEPLSDDLLALDEALDRLAQEEPAVAELVKLRYFAGMTMTQAAQILDISRRTADRHWAYARAWLHHEMHRNDTVGPI
ncbi:MAG: sigma-70 family RNA polymerase sigma factor [Phycisphaerae bacterium]|nr:sigma-70 family RNA polymerase sigma factor [Phycisphaerae bacterium]